MTRTVLIIDDEPNMRWVLARALEQAGYAVHGAESGDEADRVLAREPIDLVVLDLRLKGEDGLTVLRRLRERRPDLVVLILTAYGTVPYAVEAMQLGAADFLRKPFDVEEVIFKITRALERRAMQQELARLTGALRSAPAFEMLLGADVAWRRIVARAQQLATTEHDVVIVGEPGSGRTTLAHALHVASPRHTSPLIELDLGIYHSAAQAGVLFGADGNGGAWSEAGSGSLLLHGLGESPAIDQELIARLVERPVQSRPRLLMIASDESPLEAVAAAIPARLCVPPLRERPGDVLLLARHFAGERPVTPLAAQVLEHYTWPENIAELRSVIERAAQLAGAEPIDVVHLPERVQVAPADAPPSLGRLPPEGVNLEQLEQTLIQQALERARGNKSKAAELLGLTRHTLLYRMEKYGISAPERT